MSDEPRPTVAVDLDGVLAHYDGWHGVDHFGEPIAGAREFLTKLREKYKVVIHTTRTGEHNCVGNAETILGLQLKVRNWLIQHEMPFDSVFAGFGKPLAFAYIDDRAVLCQPQECDDAEEAYTRAEVMLDLLRQTAGWGEAQADASEQEAPTEI